MRREIATLIFQLAWLAGTAVAQENPYTEISSWAEPPSRALGSVSCTHPDVDGNIWVVERCGQNSCVGRDGFAPIHMYDANGRWVRSFGEGMLVSLTVFMSTLMVTSGLPMVVQKETVAIRCLSLARRARF